MGVWGHEIGAISADGEEDTLRYSVVEEGSDSWTGEGEPFDEGKASLGQGDPVGEVVLGIQCCQWGEPVAKPSDYTGGLEDEAI